MLYECYQNTSDGLGSEETSKSKERSLRLLLLSLSSLSLYVIFYQCQSKTNGHNILNVIIINNKSIQKEHIKRRAKYLLLVRIAMIVVNTIRMEAINAVPKVTLTRYSAPD